MDLQKEGLFKHIDHSVLTLMKIMASCIFYIYLQSDGGYPVLERIKNEELQLLLQIDWGHLKALVSREDVEDESGNQNSNLVKRQEIAKLMTPMMSLVDAIQEVMKTEVKRRREAQDRTKSKCDSPQYPQVEHDSMREEQDPQLIAKQLTMLPVKSSSKEATSQDSPKDAPQMTDAEEQLENEEDISEDSFYEFPDDNTLDENQEGLEDYQEEAQEKHLAGMPAQEGQETQT